MDLFLAVIDFSGEPADPDSEFANAIRAFSHGCSPAIWKSDRHLFLLNRVHNHFVKTSNVNGVVSYFSAVTSEKFVSLRKIAHLIFRRTATFHTAT